MKILSLDKTIFLNLCLALSALTFSPDPFHGQKAEEGPVPHAAAKRFDAWSVLGPGGGGAQFHPAINPLDPRLMLNSTDMSEGYFSEDGGNSWRMFNLRGHVRWFLWDPCDRNVAYAKTIGLFRSVDRCATWRLVHPSPSNIEKIVAVGDHGFEILRLKDRSRENIEALAIDPANSKVLMAIASNDNHWYLTLSTNGGESWEKSADLPADSSKIWIDPGSPPANRTIIVVGSNAVTMRQSGNWIHQRPVDHARSFNDVSAGRDSMHTSALYAVTGKDWRGDHSSLPSILLSRDSGANWVHLEDSLIRLLPAGTGTPGPEFQAVACCPARPEVVYVSFKGNQVASGQDARFQGVARSSDYGKNWQLVWLDGEAPAPNLRNDWITDRFGPGWGENPFCLAVAPSNPSLVLATDFGRTLRTTDSGQTWQGVFSRRTPGGDWTTTGLDMTTSYGIHFDPFDSKHWFISYTDIGLMESRDGGGSWRSVTRQGIPGHWTNTTYWMVFDPEVKGRCWAVMSGIHDLPFPKMWRDQGTRHYTGGVVTSNNSGATWQVSSSGMPETAVTDIILDLRSPRNARTLYVAGFGSGIWKSLDNGKTWNLKNQGIRSQNPFCWRIVPDTQGKLYLVVARRSYRGEIGNEEDGALYQSTDGAESWHQLPLPAGVNGPHGIAIDPRNPKRIYLACWGLYHPEGDRDGGILLSEDGGNSWNWIFQKHRHVYDVTIDPRNPDILYAGSMTFAVWRSADRGKNWSRLRGYNFKQTNRVIVDPFHPNKIFITTFGGSVWHGPATGDPSAPEDILTPEISYQR
jgi:hypothetical protein